MPDTSALPVATRYALARVAVWPGDMPRQVARGPLACSPRQRLELPATTGYRLACDGGRVDVTVSPAVLSAARVLRAAHGDVAITGEPVAFLRTAPADDGARRLADRGRRLRALAAADIDLRALACDMITAACSPAPARKLVADLGLPLNRREPRKAKRDDALASLVQHPQYAALAGTPLFEKAATDLALYFDGGWLRDHRQPVAPYKPDTWRALAWAVLRHGGRPPRWKSIKRACRGNIPMAKFLMATER